MTATNEPYVFDEDGDIVQGGRVVVVFWRIIPPTEDEKRLILAALNGGRLGCGCDGKTQWCVLCEPGAVS